MNIDMLNVVYCGDGDDDDEIKKEPMTGSE